MSSCVMAQDFLRSFRNRFDPALKAYLRRKTEAFARVHPLGERMASVMSDFVTADGKRLRPALVELGYRASGMPTTSDILQPGIGVELLHGFFLVHDDVIDRSDLRRNRPTVHRVFANQCATALAGLNPAEREHFAHSMAILIGDLACSMAYESLITSAFAPERIIAALHHMHRMMDATVIGEGLDILLPHRQTVTQDDILTVHRLKTALYTIVCPLQLGMTLGGATEDYVRMAELYGISVGIAFQIQDDYLGLFGDEREVGKPVTSDVTEGKKTLLTVFALEHATAAGRDRLHQLLGKASITADELDDVRAIVRASGAVAFSDQTARQYVDQGTAALATADIPDDVRTILYAIAEYIVQRTT